MLSLVDVLGIFLIHSTEYHALAKNNNNNSNENLQAVYQKQILQILPTKCQP